MNGTPFSQWENIPDFVEEVERHISDLAQKSELDLEYCKHFRMDMDI